MRLEEKVRFFKGYGVVVEEQFFIQHFYVHMFDYLEESSESTGNDESREKALAK